MQTTKPATTNASPASRPRRVRRAGAAAAAGLTALAVSSVAGGTASAATGDAGLVYAGSNVRSAPYTYAQLLFTSKYNAYIPLQCWTDTTESGATRRWFKYNQANEWTASTNVGQQPSLPHC